MHELLGQVLFAIGASVVLIVLCRRAGLPSVLAYLAVGIVFGPHALAFIELNQGMGFLGEIGVAFLLFTIGLEFSLPQFMAMRHVLLGLGGLQVVLGTLSGASIALWFGTPLVPAVVIGGALALSSTAIVMKQLVEQAELQERHGGLALGVLLFQDLAAVPFLVVIPILADSTDAGLSLTLALALGKAVIAVVSLLALGRYVLRPLFHEVGSAQSSELFTVTVLLVSLLAAWITEKLGLSLALGTFLAGMMLSETEFRHQIEAELQPFKDLLLGLFFITVGMQLDLTVLPEIWPWVVLLVVGLLFGKGTLIVLLTWVWVRDKAIALRTGMVLAHGGEFGLVLLALAMGTGMLTAHDAQPILAGIVVSMLLAPLLIRHNHWLCSRLIADQPTTGVDLAEVSAVTEGLSQHVVICGYGRVGQQIAHLLDAAEISYVAVDQHAASVKAAWEDGRQVFYGDATDSAMLAALGIARARILVLSFDTELAAIKTLRAAREVSDVPILVRSRDQSSIERLYDAGANEVVAETLEASVGLGDRVLSRLNVGDGLITELLNRERDIHYSGSGHRTEHD